MEVADEWEAFKALIDGTYDESKPEEKYFYEGGWTDEEDEENK